MHAVWLQPDQEFLKERARMGLDRHDEVWDGVLHMVPTPTLSHNDLEFELRMALRPIAERRGLRDHHGAAVRDPSRDWKDFRQPDVSIAHPSQQNDAAIDGAATLVVEILSPHDESREKMPFYARRGVQEVWLVHPGTRAAQVFTLQDGRYEVVPVIGGIIHAPALGITLEVIEGPKLRIRDGEYVADV